MLALSRRSLALTVEGGVAGDSPTAAAQPASDGVFLRLMALPKGRNLLARALRLLHSPLSTGQAGTWDNGTRRLTPPPTRGCSPAMRLAWALLRNVSYLFGGHAAAVAGIKRSASAKPVTQQEVQLNWNSSHLLCKFFRAACNGISTSTYSLICILAVTHSSYLSFRTTMHSFMGPTLLVCKAFHMPAAFVQNYCSCIHWHEL